MQGEKQIEKTMHTNTSEMLCKLNKQFNKVWPTATDAGRFFSESHALAQAKIIYQINANYKK